MAEKLSEGGPLKLRDVIVELGNRFRGEPMTPEEEDSFVERVMARDEEDEILARGLSPTEREELEAIYRSFENEQ